MQTKLLDKYPTLASVPSQKKALEYIEKISNQANIDISNLNVLKIFADKKSPKKIVIDVKELNKRLFSYADKTRVATQKEYIAEAQFIIKLKKLKAKGLQEELLKIAADGFWRLINITSNEVHFFNRNDLILRDVDEKLYNLGKIKLVVNRKSLNTHIFPFAHNMTDWCGSADDQPIHPYDMAPEICYGNSYSVYAMAKKSKKMSEVTKITQIVLSTYSDAGGPAVELTYFRDKMDYSHLYEDDGGEVPNMTPEADQFFEMIEATKKAQKTIKTTRKRTVIKSTTLSSFNDIYHEEDEEDEGYF
jgi:hypothetical protein